MTDIVLRSVELRQVFLDGRPLTYARFLALPERPRIRSNALQAMPNLFPRVVAVLGFVRIGARTWLLFRQGGSHGTVCRMRVSAATRPYLDDERDIEHLFPEIHLATTDTHPPSAPPSAPWPTPPALLPSPPTMANGPSPPTSTNGPNGVPDEDDIF